MTTGINTKEEIKRKLKELYIKTDSLVLQFREEKSPAEKNRIIGELLKVTEKLVKKNCSCAINREGGLTEYTVEELYNEVIGTPLTKAIQTWDSSREAYFMKWWYIQYNGEFTSLQSKEMTKKNKANKTALSLDRTDSNSDGSTHCLGDHIEDRQASIKLMSVEDQEGVQGINTMLDKFEQVYGSGWTIRAELEGTLDLSSSAMRKRLCLAKEKFKQFLISEGSVSEKWFENRNKKKKKRNK